jgi:hypothetical protein
LERAVQGGALPREGGVRYALYDRERDPGEEADVAGRRPDDLRVARRKLELFLEAGEREWSARRALFEGVPSGENRMSPEACEKLKALGYVESGVSCGG